MKSHSLQATYLSCIKSEKLIFQNLHFQASSGDLLFLKGANGSGKSTLLRMIGGFTKPSEGSITSNFEIPWNMHYFNDQDLIHPHLTPLEHLSYWSNLLHWSSFSPKNTSFHRENALHSLEFMQIHHLQNQPCRWLSLGQRKRVALSRLLLKEKTLWLLDEPILGLDISSIGILEHMIDIHLQQRGGILFLSSHSNIKLNHAVSLSM